MAITTIFSRRFLVILSVESVSKRGGACFKHVPLRMDSIYCLALLLLNKERILRGNIGSVFIMLVSYSIQDM